MPSQYVYSSLITTDTSNPYIYKDENNVIYTALNVTVDNETFIDLFMSINDGDDWYKDAVPIKNFNLYNPKFFIKNDVYYIFAYGKEYDKDAIYYIRKFTNIQDKQGNNIDDIWETDWNKVIFDSRHHCRITDITTDEIGYFVFIAYDKETDNGVYESRLAVFSLTEFSIKMDVSVNKNNLINQHNGKLTIMDDSIISVAWEMQMEDVYASKTYQIAYRQYDIVSKEWSNVVIVSNDKLNNNYHQSMTIDSDNNIFITWLNTKPDTIEYYKTNKIYLATIVNCEVSNIEEISQLAKNNEYPIVTVDEYDSLYIVYTTNDYIQYLTRKINSTEWIEITNLRQSNYQSMTAFCYNQNLYTIANKDDTAYLVRIDIDLAENFQPVDDFQIIDIDNKEISFIWTSARNAEDIKLQILLEEKDWNWVKPNTTAEVNPSTNNVNVVNLTPNRLYAFKLVYKTNDNKLHTLFFPKRLITENDIIHNYNFSWNIPVNTVEQKLYIAQELWKDIADIKNDADEYTLKYDSQATAFRLNIAGGKASGYSNIASPLTIDLLNDDYLLQWIPFLNVSKIELEQSIDGLHFFKANILPLKKTECKCIIKNTNKVTYWYRLKYISNNKVKYSNIVTLTNNLRVTHIGYNSVDIQWTTNTEEEIVKFQYTIDDGTTWKSVVNSIKNSQSIIRKLKHFTDYKLRLYYPNRFTGKYSNVISFKTLKYPVENFRLNTHPNVNILG